jgi:CSLREA domain-containing protein
MATKTNHFMRPLVALVALVALMTVVLASPAQAATLTVNTLADGPNGLCSLREAIINADENNQVGSTDCAAGFGNDTITFSVFGQINLTSPLPEITDPAGLTISNPIGPVTLSADKDNDQGISLFVVEEAELTLDNLIFSGGNSDLFTVNSIGTLTVTNSTFSGNSAGNAITNGGRLTVTNSVFSGNSGGYGAIYSVDEGSSLTDTNPTLTVTNSTFSGNSNALATTDLGQPQGGAISNGSGTATVTGSTFTGNSTTGSGGAIYNFEEGSLTVNNSTFSDNTAPDGGGGIFCDTGSFSGTQDTFTDNTGGNLVLNHCSVGLSNTILANAIQGSNCSEPILDGGYNISDDASCAFSAATSMNSTNPRLHPKGLGDHGGPTQTIRLLPNSPAIHAIPTNANGCGTDVTTDQRGILRPQGPGCDIGAFEVEHKKKKEKKEKKNHR